MTSSRKAQFILNVAFIAVIVAVAYFCLKYLLFWLLPFLIAFVIATLLQRPINWVFRHTRLHRKTISSIVTLLMVVLVMTVLGFIVVKAVMELASFMMTLPGWFAKTAPSVLEAIETRFEGLLTAFPEDWQTQLRQITTNLFTSIQTAIVGLSSVVVSWVANIAASVPSVLIGFIVTLVSTFFISAEYGKIRAFLSRQVPERYSLMLGDAWKTFGHTVSRLLQSYLLIIFITFIELAVGLSLLRVRYAVVIAALISIVDILPVLGTGTILIPWALISLILGNTWFGVCLILLYVVITIVRNVIEPRIVGHRLGIHPLVTLVFMYVGLRVLGIAGMFLFPLLFILLKNAQESGMIHLWKS